MCRNIKTLHNFDPPATAEELQAAALQFVRKLSGYNKPSKQNKAVFNQAVVDITAVASKMLIALETTAPPKNRELEKEKARQRIISSARR